MIQLNRLTRKLAIASVITLLALMPSSATAREWSEILAQGTIKIAVKDNLRPLGFVDPQGDLTGLEIELARRLATELLGDAGAAELIPVTNQQRLAAIIEGEVDLAIASVTVTAPRQRIVDFSPHYYLDGIGLITNQAEIKNLDSFAAPRIAVLRQSMAISVIRNAIPSANLIGVDSYQEAQTLLEQGQVAAFAGDRSVLTGWVQEDARYKLLPERLSGAALAVVMPKGLQYKELRHQVNQVIYRWKKSGWLQERINYWGL